MNNLNVNGFPSKQEAQLLNPNRSNLDIPLDQYDSLKGDLQDSSMKYFSIFRAPISNLVPYKRAQISEVHSMIISNLFKPQTTKLRSISDPEKRNQFKTSQFEYATFSGTFNKRSIHGLILASEYVCIDIDKVGEIEQLRLVRETILNNLIPALMFISPSGNGLKVIFEINISVGTHSEYFKALKVFFNEVIMIKIDTSGSDLSRACFLPHDEDAYYNEFPDVLDRAFLDSFDHKSKNHEFQENSHESASSNSTIPPFTAFDRLVTWMNKSETFANGNRNKFITKLANACNRFGIPISDTLYKLYDFAEPGFPRKEIESIVRNVYSHTERHNIASFEKSFENERHIFQKEGNSFNPIPIHTPLLPISGFPFHLQELIKECVRVYGTHRDFWAISFLQATAIAIGSTYQIKDKYSNGAVLWAGIVAPSGMGKSEPIDIALSPIYKADSTAEEIFNQEMNDYNAVNILSQKERKEQGIQIRPKPILKQSLVVDSTPEGLIEAHLINKRGIMIVREELMGWISDFGRYNRSGEVQNMLSSWSEKYFKVTRKGAGSSTIEKPFIPILGGIQPEKLRDLAKDGRALDGFMQRFIFAYPDQVLKPDYNEEVLSDQYLSYYNKYISTLLSISGQRKPILISRDAKQLYKKFYNENALKVNNLSCDYTRAVYQKLEIIVLRISLILHMSHHVHDQLFDHPIQPETIKAAIEMTEYFRITAQKVHQQIGYSSIITDKIDNRSVAQYLMKIGKITKTSLAYALGTSRSQLDRLLDNHGTKVQ